MSESENQVGQGGKPNENNTIDTSQVSKTVCEEVLWFIDYYSLLLIK